MPAPPPSGAAQPAAPSLSAAAASQTLLRGLDVLEHVAAGPAPLGAIAASLGVSRSTAHRLATTLLERRYLSLEPRHGYGLGPKMLELGSLAGRQIGLVRAARAALEHLAAETGEAIFLAIRDGDTVLLADSVPGARRLAPSLHIGERQDLLRSAAGRALLLGANEAEWRLIARRLGANGHEDALVDGLRQASASGLVIDRAEAEPDIATLAAPIRGADGAVHGAFGVALAAAYLDGGLLDSFSRALLDAARLASLELGWHGANATALTGVEAEHELLDTQPSAARTGSRKGPAPKRAPGGDGRKERSA